MSAFGRRNGPGGINPGARPSFGVARPMKGGERAAPAQTAPKGGEQFPPLPGQAAAPDPATPPSRSSSNRNQADALSRLAERANNPPDKERKSVVEGKSASVRVASYEMRISDWSSDVCSSDLKRTGRDQPRGSSILWRSQAHEGRRARRACANGSQGGRTVPPASRPGSRAGPGNAAFPIVVEPQSGRRDEPPGGTGQQHARQRTEERRGGKECVSTCSVIRDAH